MIKNLNQVLFENKAYLSDYDVDQTTLFEKMDESSPQLSIHASRADLTAKFKGVQIPFVKLPKYLEEEIEEQSTLLKRRRQIAVSGYSCKHDGPKNYVLKSIPRMPGWKR